MERGHDSSFFRISWQWKMLLCKSFLSCFNITFNLFTVWNKWNILHTQIRIRHPGVLAMQKFIKIALLVLSSSRCLLQLSYNLWKKQSPRQVLNPETSLKKRLAQVFSCQFCEISKSTFSYRTPPVAASIMKDID